MTLRILAISFIIVALLDAESIYAQTAAVNPGVTPPGAPGDSGEVEALNSLKNESIDKLRGLDRLQAMKESVKFISDAKLS
ncbi:MAG TPA: hypothetical protein VHL14_09340, partial [Steroidobacteraceae bacterium]|nr:hypothetical protein [Steroidobacteraceae bacterium]